MKYDPCPKPKKTIRNKNSRHQSNPLPTANDLCFACGHPYAMTHECFLGSRRNLSRLYGLTVRLCWEHHQGTSGVHGKNGLSLANELKAYGQRIWIDNHGTKEDFIRIFAVRWLLD